jgi:hypothetical protein
MLAALVSVPISYGLRMAMIQLGSYFLSKAHIGLAPFSEWSWHFTGTWESLLTLFDVDVTNFPGDTPLRATITFIGGFALLCGLLSMLRTLIRWTRVENTDRLLTIAIIMYLAAYEFSSVAAPGGGGGYEFVGIVAMSAVLSARAVSSLPPLRLPVYRVAGTAVATLAALVFLVSGTSLFQSTVSTPLKPLSAWLEQHNLTYGLAGYWNSSPVTVYTGGRVAVRPITFDRRNGVFRPRTWNARSQWFDATKNDARFVVVGEGQGDGVTVAQVENYFGEPVAIYLADGFSIMVYDHNLLTRVAAPIAGLGD